MLPMVSVFQWLFDQYLVAPLPYRLRSAKKGNATTPKGRTLRLDLSGGFDSATLARRVKTPHAALFDSGQKVGAGSAEGRLRRRRSSLARVIQGASKAQLELNLDDEADRIGPKVAERSRGASRSSARRWSAPRRPGTRPKSVGSRGCARPPRSGGAGTSTRSGSRPTSPSSAESSWPSPRTTTRSCASCRRRPGRRR